VIRGIDNRRSHIFRVPVEVLVMIFLFCDFAPAPIEWLPTVDAAWERARLLAAATSVCSRFNTVLIGASEFWNVIIFTPMGRWYDVEVVKRMIRRSGERPFHVVWDCKGALEVASYACVDALLSVKTTRIHTLSIRLTYEGTSMTAGVFEHRLGPLSLLRATRIECHDGCTNIPFVPFSVSTTMVTIASYRSISDFERHVEVNLPARLTDTLVSLRLEVFMRTRDLNEYLSHCKALLNLEWAISTLPSQVSLPALEEQAFYDRQPVLSLANTVNTIVISHPILMPVLHGPSLKYARLDVHDHHQIQAVSWEDWNIETPRVPNLKMLWLSCPCIATNGLLDSMVYSAREELEHVNLGVQMNCPKGILYAINTFRRAYTPRLHFISFSIWPKKRFHTMWEKVAMRLEKLLVERDRIHVHVVYIKHRLPKPIIHLVLRRPDDRIVLHSVPDIDRFYMESSDL
jgi:hypothetical protein